MALLMNLCLRTNGRKKCAEIAEQAINVLAVLLNHPNHEVSVAASSIPCLARLSRLFVITGSSVREFFPVFYSDSQIRP